MMKGNALFSWFRLFIPCVGVLVSMPAGATPASYKPEIVKNIGSLGGFNELVPYVLPSPHQEDAGSCLYMSLTGIAEWWLARLNPNVSRASNGPLDLSERYLINVSENKKYQTHIENWRTDSIEILNATGQSVLNSSYPFAKGWYREDSKGDIFPARPNGPDSVYGVIFSWYDNLKSITSGFVPLPRFKRDVLFADPDQNEWNVGLNPEGIVETVKQALVKNKAPVQVIYNHESVWHSVFVVGFDDDRDSRECGFVESSLKYFGELEKEFRQQSQQASSEAERKKYADKAKVQRANRLKLSKSYEAAGGCRGRGVFYVRNSEFSGSDGTYDYDPDVSGEERPYAPRIMLFEYEWLEHLANHVTQISVR
ncbi:MAG: hypothetical protein RIR26_2359 [Pseudomonadota bacterium]